MTANILNTLNDYEPNKLKIILEERLEKEKDADLKLLIAAVASIKGSTIGALHLLESMKHTDSHTVIGLQHLLGKVYLQYEQAPEWIVKVMMAAIADNRYITKARQGMGFNKLSYLAAEENHLVHMISNTKTNSVYDLLIKMCKETNGDRTYVVALDRFGDKRAIPILLECLKRAGKNYQFNENFLHGDNFIRPVYALSNLNAKEAVPELLKYIVFPEVIESISSIKDDRIIAALNELKAANGVIKKDIVGKYPKLRIKRLIACKIALAKLDKKDPSTELMKVYNDKTFNEFNRREIVWSLAKFKEAKAVPFLINLIKTDKSGVVVNQSITVLSIFKYKSTVDGLIECFDADFKGKSDWKRAYNSEMFRDNIAKSLTELTGQKIKADKASWLKWWRLNRESFKEAK